MTSDFPQLPELTGAEIDSNGVLVSTSEDDGKPVAVRLQSKEGKRQNTVISGYTSVKFAGSGTNLETKGESNKLPDTKH